MATDITDEQILAAIADSEGNRAAAARSLGMPASTLRDRVRKVGSDLQVKPKGSFVRFIIPDSHGFYADPAAIDAMFQDMEHVRPEEVVHLGDALDAGGFLAQHHKKAYIPELSYTYEEDIEAAGALFDRVSVIAPKADIHYIWGNHESRIDKWAIDNCGGSQKDASLLGGAMSPETMLSLKGRNINVYKQGEFYGGLSIPGTIKLGHCYMTHGSFVGVNAPRQHLAQFGGNVLFGHTHRLASVTSRNVHQGVIGAWNVGCVSKLQPLWRHTSLTGWAHGYALQFVSSDGSFITLLVPIINGQSYLVPLTEMMGR